MQPYLARNVIKVTNVIKNTNKGNTVKVSIVCPKCSFLIITEQASSSSSSSSPNIASLEGTNCFVRFSIYSVLSLGTIMTEHITAALEKKIKCKVTPTLKSIGLARPLTHTLAKTYRQTLILKFTNVLQ